ncbi:MAG: cytochrome c biogenesis protein ResB [Planctomycetota bacterium]
MTLTVKLLTLLKNPRFIIALMTAVILSIAAGSFWPTEQAEKFVYHTRWFNGLLMLFGFCTILSALRKNSFKFNRLGFVLTHLSVILMALGIILYSVKGTWISCSLSPGDSIEKIPGVKDDEFIPLGFKMYLADFNVIKNDQGEIKQYHSNIHIYHNDHLVLKKNITVNDPLRYNGWTVYQMDYDKKIEKRTVLEIKKDPGIPFVYAGFLLMTIGLTWLTFKRV